MECPNPTTTGPQTQIHIPPPADTRTPYRITFAETRYRTLDVLACDEQEAANIASENTEYALDGACVDFGIARTCECYAFDFSPINE